MGRVNNHINRAMATGLALSNNDEERFKNRIKLNTPQHLIRKPTMGLPDMFLRANPSPRLFDSISLNHIHPNVKGEYDGIDVCRSNLKKGRCNEKN